MESLSSTDGIATTQVFKVIRKRVQRADGGIRVPARLELHALALNRALLVQHPFCNFPEH